MLTAKPKIKSCTIGGTKSIVRIRASRSACRNSFRMMTMMRSLMALSQLLFHLSRSEEEYRCAVYRQEQQLIPQHLGVHTLEKDTLHDRDDIARRDYVRNRLNHPRHRVNRVDEPGKHKR